MQKILCLFVIHNFWVLQLCSWDMQFFLKTDMQNPNFWWFWHSPKNCSLIFMCHFPIFLANIPHISFSMQSGATNDHIVGFYHALDFLKCDVIRKSQVRHPLKHHFECLFDAQSSRFQNCFHICIKEAKNSPNIWEHY